MNGPAVYPGRDTRETIQSTIVFGNTRVTFSAFKVVIKCVIFYIFFTRKGWKTIFVSFCVGMSNQLTTYHIKKSTKYGNFQGKDSFIWCMRNKLNTSQIIRRIGIFIEVMQLQLRCYLEAGLCSLGVASYEYEHWIKYSWNMLA